MIVSRVCVVALPSGLVQYSKSCCFACGVVRLVLSLFCDCIACVCACLMACSLDVVIVVLVGIDVVVGVVVMIALVGGIIGVPFGRGAIVVFDVVVIARVLVLVLLK